MIHRTDEISDQKTIYVASDFHLTGISSERETVKEQKAVRWLESIKQNADVLILAGDIFDFWFEYKRAVPKGMIRLLGKLAELSDNGTEIILFKGNHDLWMSQYLQKELKAKIYSHPVSFQIGSQHIMIGHGDGLGPGDRKFKIIKKVFTSPINRFLFRWLHPDIGLKLGQYWSQRSYRKNLQKPDPYLGDQEPLYIWCKTTESRKHHDFYIFGHRHLQYETHVSPNSKYINLGDWMSDGCYIEISSGNVNVLKVES